MNNFKEFLEQILDANINHKLKWNIVPEDDFVSIINQPFELSITLKYDYDIGEHYYYYVYKDKMIGAHGERVFEGNTYYYLISNLYDSAKFSSWLAPTLNF